MPIQLEQDQHIAPANLNSANANPANANPANVNPANVGAALAARYTTTSNAENIVVLATFILVLFTLTSISLFRTDDNAALIENRVAAPFPKFSLHRKDLRNFQTAFETWFTDRFAFKSNLVGARNFFLLKALNTSGSPPVIIGKNNFLFWKDDGQLALIRHDYPFTEWQLLAWKNLLEGRSKWCQEHGMDYYYVIAPSKATIYRENLPDCYTVSNPKSRREQLLDYLKDTHSSVKVVDLTPALMASKKSRIRYYYTDTHWNQLGAQAGCVQLINTISKRHPTVGKPISEPDIFVAPFVYSTGDLARLLGVLGMINEDNLFYVFKNPGKYKWQFYSNEYRNELGVEASRPQFATIKGSTQPTAIMFHDSFTSALSIFLSCNFSKIGYFWQPDFDRDLVLKEHPQIVLQEQVENKLYLEIPQQ